MPIADDPIPAGAVARPAPPLAAVPNLRDAGGLPAAGGARVRTGLLYRSGQLDKLAGDVLEAFALLGVGTVVDLRTDAERVRSPNRLPEGVEVVVADVLGDRAAMAPAQLMQLASDPRQVTDAVRGGHVQALFTRTYREFVTEPSAHAAYRVLYSRIADGDERDGRPLLFHCTAGKDRTGWAAAALLLLLGVPDGSVLEDFMLSDRLALASFTPLVELFASRGGDPDMLRPILGVEPAYLGAALDQLETSFGSIEAWFADALGIDADVQERLRARLLER